MMMNLSVSFWGTMVVASATLFIERVCFRSPLWRRGVPAATAAAVLEPVRAATAVVPELAPAALVVVPEPVEVQAPTRRSQRLRRSDKP